MGWLRKTPGGSPLLSRFRLLGPQEGTQSLTVLMTKQAHSIPASLSPGSPQFFALRWSLLFWRALHVPDPTSKSRRDGVKVAQDVSPGLHVGLDLKESRQGRLKNVCDKFSRPLRDWTHLVNPTQDCVLGYFHAVLFGTAACTR